MIRNRGSKDDEQRAVSLAYRNQPSASAIRHYKRYPSQHQRAAHPSASRAAAEPGTRSFTHDSRWLGQPRGEGVFQCKLPSARELPSARSDSSPHDCRCYRSGGNFVNYQMGDDPPTYREPAPSYREQYSSREPSDSFHTDWNPIRPDVSNLPSARDRWRAPRPGDWYDA